MSYLARSLVASAIALACSAWSDKPSLSMLDVFLTPEMSTCSCSASMSFSGPNNSTNGQIYQGGNLVAQIVWADPSMTKGSCNRDGETCLPITDSLCKASFDPLTVSLYGTWGGGKFIKASDLQNGQVFFYQDDDGVPFEPGDLESTCGNGNPTTDSYQIEFFTDGTGSTSEALFKMTLTCSACSPDA